MEAGNFHSEGSAADGVVHGSYAVPAEVLSLG